MPSFRRPTAIIAAAFLAGAAIAEVAIRATRADAAERPGLVAEDARAESAASPRCPYTGAVTVARPRVSANL